MTKDITKQIELYCSSMGKPLTQPRRAVLSILTKSNRPLGAYEIVSAMPRGTKAPTVYRALDFWESAGFIHRIESLNAYRFCHAEHRHRGGQYLVCDSCGNVTEAHLCHLPEVLRERAVQGNFRPTHWNLEIHGLCDSCSTSPG